MQRTAGIRSLVPGSDPSRRSFRGAALLGTLKNPIICETAKLGVLENDVQQRDRQTDRQTNSQAAGRQAGGWAGGRTDGQTGRQTDRPTDRQTNRRTHTATHTHTDCHTHTCFVCSTKLHVPDQGIKDPRVLAPVSASRIQFSAGLAAAIRFVCLFLHLYPVLNGRNTEVKLA